MQEQDTETAEEEVAVVEAQAEQVQQVEQVHPEQFLSTGNLPNAEDLEYKLYAMVKDGIVLGATWDNTPQDGIEFVLMTFENSPAYTQGTYKEGKFYKPEETNG